MQSAEHVWEGYWRSRHAPGCVQQWGAVLVSWAAKGYRNLSWHLGERYRLAECVVHGVCTPSTARTAATGMARHVPQRPTLNRKWK